jgi:hypothetical protein
VYRYVAKDALADCIRHPSLAQAAEIVVVAQVPVPVPVALVVPQA